MTEEQRHQAVVEHGLPTTEKVRGMNASLTPAHGPGPLRERTPVRLIQVERRVVTGVGVAAAAVAALVFTITSLGSSTRSYSAVVTSSQVYDLNFPNSGTVTQIAVAVGQHVTPGQVIARQDTTGLEAAVVAAQGVLKADQQTLQQAQDPQITPAQVEQDRLQVQQAQTALSNAEANLAAAIASGRTTVAAAETAATSDQELVTADQERYNQVCPDGLVEPTAGSNGQASQVAQSQYTQCQDLQSQLDKDQATLYQAQSQVSVVGAQAQDTINQDDSAVNSAQSALELAQYQQTLQTSPTSPTAIAQASAAVSQAQGQLQAAQQALDKATLLAPASGTVAEVDGAVGEVLGPDGVRQYQGPSSISAAQTPSFQLFPSPTTPGGASSNDTTEPLVELIGGEQQVMAQVPEKDIGRFHDGQTLTVGLADLHTSVTGTVSSIVLSAARTATSVTYNVVVSLAHPISGLLPGMSASVAL